MSVYWFYILIFLNLFTLLLFYFLTFYYLCTRIQDLYFTGSCPNVFNQFLIR